MLEGDQDHPHWVSLRQSSHCLLCKGSWLQIGQKDASYIYTAGNVHTT